MNLYRRVLLCDRVSLSCCSAEGVLSIKSHVSGCGGATRGLCRVPKRPRLLLSTLEPPTRKARKQEENNKFWCCFGLARPLDASFLTENPFTNQVRHSGKIRPHFRQPPTPLRPLPIVLIRRPVLRIFQNTEEYRICGHLITILFMSDWLYAKRVQI